MYTDISILGSTGSIGTQTLEVCRRFGIRVVALSANTSLDVLREQVNEFAPKIVALSDKKHAEKFAGMIDTSKTKVLWGLDGLKEVATADGVQCVVSAIVGIAGLIPTLEAIKADKHIALANKEVLVTAGALIMGEIEKRGLSLLPVDSEHSAIFQCLMGNKVKEVEKIILTCSGGPFRGMSAEALESVTLEDALNHPKWKMGSKITIDSATLMNKGLEVIEARWLFGVKPEKIEVVIHPQSIVHSLVEYKDSSVMAQLGIPDMKLPIQFALTYPNRLSGGLEPLDLVKAGKLEFFEPDLRAFRCLKLAYDALKIGGSMPVALNAANEVAVGLFLEKKISFMEISDIIERVMSRHEVFKKPSLEEILYADFDARKTAVEVAK
ncbi:MAG: 1-deoxy-D-xylulose-5-phosphate reductoisomerase [Bacillota bacterium]